MLLTPPDRLAAALVELDSTVIAVQPPGVTGGYRSDVVPVVSAGALVLTSGSTGPPKAVLLSAAAIRASVAATHDRLGGPADWVSALPVQHVAGFMTVARAVLSGHRVHHVRSDLADLPASGGYCSLVPAQLSRALDDPTVRDRLRHYTILLGGQAAPPELVARAREHLRVVTTYGMAETCGGCVYDGVPLDGVRVRIEQGRILLGGTTVFSGYHGDERASAQVLQDGWVLTQDRGRLQDGVLQVSGRLDDVVISGGYKIDLAELQEHCRRLWGEQVKVFAVPDQRWGQRVVALSIAEVDLADVVAGLRPVVAPAALPKELRRVQRWAYTTTGKIDRSALAQQWEAGDGKGR